MRLAGVALALASALGAPRALGGEAAAGELRYKGKKLALDALPPEIRAEAAAAAQRFAPWCQLAHYKLELSADQRVIVAVPKEGSAADEFALLAKAAKLFDQLVAPASGASAASAPASEPAAAVPGAAAAQPVPVIVPAESELDYENLVGWLGRSVPSLASWAEGAHERAGFAVGEPLCAAYLAHGGKGLEEWSPKAELVHRAGQLFVAQRNGTVPYCIEQGIAWHLEHELCGGIWCFPYRAGFVFAKEHASWESTLAARFRGRLPKDPLSAAELFALRRGRYDEEAAQASWGAVGALARCYPGGLGALLDDCQRTRDSQGRVVHEDGSWEIRADWRPSDAQLLELLVARTEPGILEVLSEAFAKGRSYRRAK